MFFCFVDTVIRCRKNRRQGVGFFFVLLARSCCLPRRDQISCFFWQRRQTRPCFVQFAFSWCGSLSSLNFIGCLSYGNRGIVHEEKGKINRLRPRPSYVLTFIYFRAAGVLSYYFSSLFLSYQCCNWFESHSRQ